MIGFIKFLNIERHFGFIRYASQPGFDRLDKEVHFHGSSLRESVCAGDRVEFQIAQREDGRETAIDITPIEAPRFTGTVCSIGKRQYGFVNVDGRCEDLQRVFFAHDDVFPDILGRRAMPVGTPVSFEIILQEGRERAVRVRNEDPELSQIDPVTYTEIGQVSYYDSDRGHIVRPNGDTLSFLAKNVVSEGVESIHIGSWLTYGIDVALFLFDKQTEMFRHRVYARDICVCLGDDQTQSQPESSYEPGSAEAFFENAPELPLGAPPVVPRKAGELFTSRKENESPNYHFA